MGQGDSGCERQDTTKKRKDKTVIWQQAQLDKRNIIVINRAQVTALDVAWRTDTAK